MRYILPLLFLLSSCSSMKKSKSHVSIDSTAVAVHKETTVAKKKDSAASGKSMITRNKKVKKDTKETTPVITWVKVDTGATFTGPEEHVTINVKGGKLIGIKGTKTKETKEDKTDSSSQFATTNSHVTEQADTASKSDSSATTLSKDTTIKTKDSVQFHWWWLLLLAIAGGCYWLFFTKSGKEWKSNAIGWAVSKFI